MTMMVRMKDDPEFDVSAAHVSQEVLRDVHSKHLPKRRPAVSFLENGVKILGERAALRDQPNGERSMAKTVAIFNAWTGNNLSVEDGWRFMIALKQAREIQGFFNADDYEDGANYFALLGEEESANEKRQKPQG
jgi:hypothetical protein